MINPKELWIGDILKLKSSCRIGKFEGIKGTKLKVNVAGKIVLTTASNVEHHSESSTSKPKVHKQKQTLRQDAFNPILDLHIERLAPSLGNSRAEHILNYQIRAARNHIETAIKQKAFTIEIIHGIGTGVLKSEISFLISKYPQVIYFHSSKNGGAIVIVF